MSKNYGRRWHQLPPELQIEARREFINSFFGIFYPASELSRSHDAASKVLLCSLFGYTYLIMSEKWSRKTLIEYYHHDEAEVDEFLYKLYHADYYDSLKR